MRYSRSMRPVSCRHSAKSSLTRRQELSHVLAFRIRRIPWGCVGNRSLHRKVYRETLNKQRSNNTAWCVVICLHLLCRGCLHVVISAEPLYARKLLHVPVRCSRDRACFFASHLDFSRRDHCAVDCFGDLLVSRICNAKSEASPSWAEVYSTTKLTIVWVTSERS